jgi:hypothetical protein
VLAILTGIVNGNLYIQVKNAHQNICLCFILVKMLNTCLCFDFV